MHNAGSGAYNACYVGTVSLPWTDPLTGTTRSRLYHLFNRSWMEYNAASSGNHFFNPETRTVLQPQYPGGCLIAADAGFVSWTALALQYCTGTTKAYTGYTGSYTVENASWTADGQPAIPFADEWEAGISPVHNEFHTRPSVMRLSASDWLVAWDRVRWEVVDGTLRVFHRVRAFRYSALTGKAEQVMNAEGLLYTSTDFGSAGGSAVWGVDDTSLQLTYEPASGELAVWGQMGASAGVYNTGVYQATYRARFGRISQDAQMPLGTIVRDLCLRSGLADGDIDVSDLTPMVRGYAVGRPSTAREAIEGLRLAFLFDGAEIDGKLVFRLRGQEPVATLVETDLAASSSVGNENDPRLTETRTQEVELPQRITVRYPDPTLDYQPGSQVAQRASSAIRAGDEQIIDTGVVLTADEAKALAERHLLLAWIGRMNYEWAVPVTALRFDPTDVLRLQVGDVLHQVLLRKVDLGADGVVRMQGIADQPYAYVAIARPACSAPFLRNWRWSARCTWRSWTSRC